MRSSSLTSHNEPELSKPPSAFLEGVLRRGRQIIRRRRVIRSVSIVSTFAIASTASILFFERSPKPPNVLVAPVTTGPNSEELPDGGHATPSSLSSPSDQPSSEQPLDTSAPPPLRCHNSTNPECGRFRWDPKPGSNSPISIQVTFSPQSPTAGEEVIFTVSISDPDAMIHRDSYSVSFGEGGTVVDPRGPLEDFPSCDRRYGPWAPPRKVSDHWETTFTHVYESAGTYTAGFAFHSHNFDQCQDAYGSRGAGSVTLTVE